MNMHRSVKVYWPQAVIFSLLLVACGPTVADPASSRPELEVTSAEKSETTREGGAPRSIADEGSAADNSETAGDDVKASAETTDLWAADESIETRTEVGVNVREELEAEASEDVVIDTEEEQPAEDSEVAIEEIVQESPNEEPLVEDNLEVPEDGISETQETAADPGMLTEDDRHEILQAVTDRWNTNWNRHTVPYAELLPVQARDRIRSIDSPVFESLVQAADWLTDTEAVLSFELNGVARAYPLQILNLHEIVNDKVGDTPVAITYCPLCNSAVVFDRRLDGDILEFGTSGLLRYSDLVMYDRETESLWQQFTGEGMVGDLAGKWLTILPSSLVSFSSFRDAYPEGRVLSQDTGYPFSYGLNPYMGYDTFQHSLSRNGSFALFAREQDGDISTLPVDDRLSAVERVVSIAFADGISVAYPVTQLAEVGVINDAPGGHDIVIFHRPGTASALDGQNVADGREVGATGVFNPILNEQKLTFFLSGEDIVDEQTRSIWNVLGQAVEGSLAGARLSPIVHGDHFWFSWAAFHPHTIIYGQ